MFHVPFPVVLVFEGVNRHSSEVVVEQEPVYAEISPAADIDGQKLLDSSCRNGKSDVRVCTFMFEVDIVEEMLSATSCCEEPEPDGRKTYATSVLEEDPSGRRMIVGVYGRD